MRLVTPLVLLLLLLVVCCFHLELLLEQAGQLLCWVDHVRQGYGLQLAIATSAILQIETLVELLLQLENGLYLVLLLNQVRSLGQI